MFSAKLRKETVELLTGPSANYSVNSSIAKGTDATVVARSEDGRMMFVQAEGASGWASLSTMVVQGDTKALPVWKNAMGHAAIVEPRATAAPTTPTPKPEATPVVEPVAEVASVTTDTPVAEPAVAEPAEIEEVADVAPVDAVTAEDGLSTGTVTSASDLKNGPSYAYETITWIPEDAKVVLQSLSADGHWVYVSGEKGGGWLPISKIETSNDISGLPKSVETSEGALYMPRGVVNKSPHTGRYLKPKSTQETMLGVVPHGTEVRIIGRNEDSSWVFAMVEGGDGWMSTQLLDLLDKVDLNKVSLWADAEGTNQA